MTAVKKCSTCNVESEVPLGILVDLRCQTPRCKGTTVTFDRKIRRKLQGEELWEKFEVGEIVPVCRSGNCLWFFQFRELTVEPLPKVKPAPVITPSALLVKEQKGKEEATIGRKPRKQNPK